MLRMPVILIDPGHGRETPGKRSPDGKFREYSWAREIADKIADRLREKGYTAFPLFHGEEDMPLKERVSREHAYWNRYGRGNVILISIHANASGDGSKWMNARGWSAYTSKGDTKSDDLADILYKHAEQNFKGLKIRRDYSDGDADWEENFYILKNTYCPAVLTENFFQDNKDDVAYITSDAGKEAVVKCHTDAIEEYISLNY